MIVNMISMNIHDEIAPEVQLHPFAAGGLQYSAHRSLVVKFPIDALKQRAFCYGNFGLCLHESLSPTLNVASALKTSRAYMSN
jgi:hypothetical protein